MAYPQGINFRMTVGYVTDIPPSELSVASSADYPRTTAAGNTVGWETVNTINEDVHAANDARLAGDADLLSNSDYRFDLPAAGNYNIRSAAGGQNGTGTRIDLYDTSSFLTHLSETSTTADNDFRDARDNLLTNVTWPTSNVAYAATFSTTICRFRCIGSACFVNHLYVEQAQVELPVVQVVMGGARSRHEMVGY